jgi:hypothetical protein
MNEAYSQGRTSAESRPLRSTGLGQLCLVAEVSGLKYYVKLPMHLGWFLHSSAMQPSRDFSVSGIPGE